MYFVRLLLLAPFCMSMPVRYCLEEKRRRANYIVGLPLGSPEGIDTTKKKQKLKQKICTVEQ